MIDTEDGTQEDTLAALGPDPSKREPFLEALAAVGVWVVFKRLEKAESEFFDYSENGAHFFPVFSSMATAGEFIRKIAPPDQITSYPCLQLAASFLFQNDFSKSKVILNPHLPGETIITAEDLRRLSELVPPTDQPADVESS